MKIPLNRMFVIAPPHFFVVNNKQIIRKDNQRSTTNGILDFSYLARHLKRCDLYGSRLLISEESETVFRLSLIPKSSKFVPFYVRI